MLATDIKTSLAAREELRTVYHHTGDLLALLIAALAINSAEAGAASVECIVARLRSGDAPMSMDISSRVETVARWLQLLGSARICTEHNGLYCLDNEARFAIALYGAREWVARHLNIVAIHGDDVQVGAGNLQTYGKAGQAATGSIAELRGEALQRINQRGGEEDWEDVGYMLDDAISRANQAANDGTPVEDGWDEWARNAGISPEASDDVEPLYRAAYAEIAGNEQAVQK